MMTLLGIMQWCKTKSWNFSHTNKRDKLSDIISRLYYALYSISNHLEQFLVLPILYFSSDINWKWTESMDRSQAHKHFGNRLKINQLILLRKVLFFFATYMSSCVIYLIFTYIFMISVQLKSTIIFVSLNKILNL